jgi:hypothetical protein
MQKLVRKIKSISDVENIVWGRKGRSLKTFGLFVSNADGITKEANKLAKSEGIKSLQAKLSESWYKHNDWRILGCLDLPVLNPIDTND